MKQTQLKTDLKRHILSSTLTRYQIAKLSGVSQSVLSRFVHSKRDIGIKSAAKVAALLNLKLSKLEGEGE
jgi:transcriptional regulator with XRE-family HTH domain